MFAWRSPHRPVGYRDQKVPYVWPICECRFLQFGHPALATASRVKAAGRWCRRRRGGHVGTIAHRADLGKSLATSETDEVAGQERNEITRQIGRPFPLLDRALEERAALISELIPGSLDRYA